MPVEKHKLENVKYFDVNKKNQMTTSVLKQDQNK